jgi:NADH/NAD ratio-sensing transcriptional regulator Rex
MDAGVLTSRWDFAWNLVRDQVNGIDVGDAVLGKYKGMDPEKMKSQMVIDVIGSDIGDTEKKMEVTEAPRMLSILLGSPSFQQQ